MSLKHGLLGLLSVEGPTTGYNLDKFFKHSLNYFWQAKTSQIYRELSSMESMGWLTSERVVQEEKPNKRVYSITPAGKAELTDWLCLPVENHGMKSAFLMRIFLGREVGKEQTLKLIREYRERVIAASKVLEGPRSDIAADEAEYPEHSKYWELTILHGEISVKAAIEWADKAIAILEESEE